MVYRATINISDRLDDATISYLGETYTLNEEDGYQVETSDESVITLNQYDQKTTIDFVGEIVHSIQEGNPLTVSSSEFLPFTIDENYSSVDEYTVQPSTLYAWLLDDTTAIYTSKTEPQYLWATYNNSGVKSTTFGDYTDCDIENRISNYIVIGAYYEGSYTQINATRASQYDLVWNSNTQSYDGDTPSPPVPVTHLPVKELEANGSVYDIVSKSVVNQNGSDSLKVWSGTTAQYDAIETKDPNTLYNITDDTVIGDNAADRNLSNLTSTGKNISTWSSNVSNCITHIPQDIKLELNNGTLTLKAGSKVYVPNGFEQDGTTPKFDTKIIESDLTYQAETSGQWLIIINGDANALDRRKVSETYSGSTEPSGYSGAIIWYDTENNVLKKLYNGVLQNTTALPLGLMTGDGTSITSIYQVFNGFGAFGSTVFCLPGVKGLIANGRNEDGSLKSTPVESENVLIHSYTDSAEGELYFQLVENGIGRSNYKGWYYNAEENYVYWNNSGFQRQLSLLCGKFEGNNGKYTVTNIPQVIQVSNNLQKTGDTMSGDLTIAPLENEKLKLVNPYYRKGTTPSEQQYISLVFNDKINDSVYADYKNTRLAVIESIVNTNKSTALKIATYNNDITSTDSASLNLNMSASGVASCSFPNTTCVDGQWVKKSSTLENQVSYAVGTNSKNFDLSSYLPNNNYNYEVMIQAEGNTGGSSGASIILRLSSDIMTDNMVIYRVVTRASGSAASGGTIIIPVGTGRTITRQAEVSTAATGKAYLWLKGYRRIGTNR